LSFKFAFSLFHISDVEIYSQPVDSVDNSVDNLRTAISVISKRETTGISTLWFPILLLVQTTANYGLKLQSRCCLSFASKWC